MYKSFLAYFFTLIFAVLITAPTVISMFEDSIDVSVFFGVNEEENNEKETSKTLELVFTESKNVEQSIIYTENSKNTSYYFNSYKKFHLENISPPPEYII